MAKRPVTPAEALKWDVVNEKALSCLILHVKPSQLIHIKLCVTAYEAWQKLKEVHMPSSPERKCYLYQKLVNLKMQSNDKVDVYVYSFVEIIGKLSELDIKINEELQVIMLLTGLPEN